MSEHRKYVWEPQKLSFELYETFLLKCRHCGHAFEDKENHCTAIGDGKILVCEKCSEELKALIDFDIKGSREPVVQKWAWMRRLALTRDNYRCRVCGDYDHKDGVRSLEVHHIIPLKDGGTHNLKNLVTLCVKHHTETFSNDYTGLKIMDRLVQEGVQRQLSSNTKIASEEPLACR